eukprot:CAMPEP_0115864062 /NCGR_PEP_ID=MMETSP0287-20121206/19004_1 /TAXON_ID=412157 /ORGANISM="Chrysochromulina rotalis, Strain UIO044" /LENGTH=342 /DNA_ID=CAMNT_0003318515 /DNA_START=123 /DNA_END=1151 /DNA_ORIENTATION=-
MAVSIVSTSDVPACGAEFGICTDSACCSNPGFGCYKRVGKHYAQCKRNVDQCQDSDEWLCPESWAQCTDPFADCRASLCCREPGYECVRRAHLYYAQCRRMPEDARQSGACTEWTSNGPDEKWLCPGWEQCAQPEEECTMSRCCTDNGYGCYLDEEMEAAGEGWHAYCRPLRNDTETSTSSSEADAALAPASPTSTLLTMATHEKIKAIKNFTMAVLANPRLCEGRSTYFCRSIYKQGRLEHETYEDYLHNIITAVEDYEKEVSPLTVALVVLGSTFAALCAIACGAMQYSRMRARAIQAELELQALRVFSHQPSHSQDGHNPMAIPAACNADEVHGQDASA